MSSHDHTALAAVEQELSQDRPSVSDLPRPGSTARQLVPLPNHNQRVNSIADIEKDQESVLARLAKIAANLSMSAQCLVGAGRPPVIAAAKSNEGSAMQRIDARQARIRQLLDAIEHHTETLRVALGG